MISSRKEILTGFSSRQRARLSASRTASRNSIPKRLRVVKRDANTAVGEEDPVGADSVQSMTDSGILGEIVPAPVREPVADSVKSAGKSGDISSLGVEIGSFFENFTIPVDYFKPFVVTGVVSSVLGLLQSIQGAPNLDGFSVDNLVHFQLPIQSALFGSVFLQAVAGCGFALAAIAGVSILGPGVTVKDAQALVALLAVPVDAGMFLPYFQSRKFDKAVVDKWVVGALVATPVGVAGLKLVDEKVALLALGSTILGYCGYATYTILQSYYSDASNQSKEAPGSNGNTGSNGSNSSNGSEGDESQSPAESVAANPSCKTPPEKYPVLGTWGSGVLAGLLGGAFDAPGPPLVIFADVTGMARSAELTRANLLAFFALDSQLVAFTDLADGRFNLPYIWPTVLLAIPTMYLANSAGNWCGQFVDQDKFRWVVIGLLTVCGLHQVGAI